MSEGSAKEFMMAKIKQAEEALKAGQKIPYGCDEFVVVTAMWNVLSEQFKEAQAHD